MFGKFLDGLDFFKMHEEKLALHSGMISASFLLNEKENCVGFR